VGPPYALNAIVVSEVFYKISAGYWFNLVLVLATQLTGFGLAGMCRRFLVWPASMVWPQNLVACTLLNTLHAEDDDGTGGITRYKYFMILLTGAFGFFFFPGEPLILVIFTLLIYSSSLVSTGYIFRALSVFSFVCWLAPNNVPINQLFGVEGGLGMSVLTFDWVQITWIGSPLMVPWWAEVHIFTGFVLFFWILTPALYYSNVSIVYRVFLSMVIDAYPSSQVWQLSHFPMSADQPFDRFGKTYNVTRVLQRDDTFNVTAYEEYSPLYLPATYAVTYLLAFTLSTCVIVHTMLYHGRSLWKGVKKIRFEEDDIHAKLMRNYPEVPDWWYLTSFIVFFCMAIVAVEVGNFYSPQLCCHAELYVFVQVWDTGVPVWALLLAVMLPIVYILPSGFIYAMTSQGVCFFVFFVLHVLTDGRIVRYL
jgi:OPT family oligopeptide transporter